jgi:hypothetical protein
VTLDEAKFAIRAGALFGECSPRIADSGERWQLADWFVREPGLPNLAARQQQAAPAPAPTRHVAEGGGAIHSAPLPESTGEVCKKCGGLMVRTGTCYTCQSCGESSGGCG